MAKRIFITGGTGFVGGAIVAALCERGDHVIVVTRDRESATQRLGDGVEVIEGDPTCAGAWQGALANADAVVNLAGQSVGGKRWSAHYKQILHDSRVDTTRYVVEGIGALEPDDRPSVLVSASGVDYYPFSVDIGAALAMDEDDDVVESAPPGSSPLARICRNWEAEARDASALGVRVALMRLGIVLGDGGALSRMKTPFRLFFGGRIASGRQWVSWIHLADAVAGFLFAIDNASVTGPVNLVSPGPVRNSDFSKALGKALGRPSWLPVPAFAVKARVGELADYILNGRRAVPTALERCGFEFRFPEAGLALEDVFSR